MLASIEDGYIVFETTHLSEYGIIATNNVIENPKTGDNILFYEVIFGLSITVIAGLFVLKKRMN